jgi:hypothetical protein
MSRLATGRSAAPPFRRLTFHLIPHTHWDREWYLTRSAFQARLVPVLDDLLEQLDRDPEARFVLDGQTVLLGDYLAVKPEQEARISALVRRGALEIGPWFVLADLFVPGAASLRRNLEEGARDALRFGRRMDVLYSPDAFGHPAGLPDLAAEFGIRRAVIRRGLGRPLGRDRDLYRWETPGGGSLLVHHLPAGGYDGAIDLAEAGDRLPRIWAPIRRELVARAVSDQVAVFVGADHHAMARDVSGLRARLAALESGHAVRVSGLTEYFDAVEHARPDPPVIRGELRRGDGHTWVLQGVHATRARMKRRHGSAELLLSRIAAPLSQRALEEGGADRSGLLRVAWRTLLESQFHDTLAGTTSDEVQREQAVRLAAVRALAGEIAAASLGELAGYDPDRSREHRGAAEPRLLLWNPSDLPRSGIVTAELTFFRRDILVGAPDGRRPAVGKGHEPFGLVAPSGEIVAVQELAVRRGQERRDAARHYPDQDEVDRVWVAFRAPEVPASALCPLTPRAMRRDPPAAGLEAGDGFLANRFVAVHLSPTGALALEDRRTGERYDGLARLEDEPDAGDTYTFSRGASRAVRNGTTGSRRVIAGGPLVGAVEARWSMESAGKGGSGLRLLVVLHADSAVVRLRFDVDNGATDHRLRARFPVGAGDDALAGGAFGPVRRPPATAAHRGAALEHPVATAPAHRFVAAAAGSRGLVVLAPGFFEYEWTRKRELVVTLLRSVGELSRADLAERPGHAGWPEPTPLAQEPGRHTIALALAPAAEDDLGNPDRLERLWEDAFLPVQAVFLRDFVSRS